jgi:ABC-type transporter Mla subunit MlaD
VYRSLVKEIESSAKLLGQAKIDSELGALHLQESARTMKEMLDRTRETVGGLRGVSDALGVTVQQAKSTVDNSASVLKASSDSVRQYQRFLEELSNKWPALTRRYLEDSDQAFAKIASAWKAQSEAIGNSVGRISEGFASSATDFAEAVQELGEQITKLRGEHAASPLRARGV